MPLARSFENLLVVLCDAGLPPIADWTAELQGAGLDIEVHPPRYDYLTHAYLVPMSVRGNLAPVAFDWASTHHYDWFPSEISKAHSKRAVLLVFSPRGDGHAPWEQAAFWAAAGSLLRLDRAVLFDSGGTRTDSPASFYAKVRRHLSDVIPQPHPDPNDPSLDLRTERARQYDQYHPW